MTDIAGSDVTNSINRANHLLKEGQSSKMILAMLIESDEEEPRGTAPAESSMAVQQSAMLHLNAIHT